MPIDTQSLHVVQGGLDRSAQIADQAILTQPAPTHCAAELAADMAEIYAMALLRDVPFAAVCDPHHTVVVDAGTRFTLHELLCELRNLSWFDRRAIPSLGADGAAFSRAGQGQSGHRRPQRWNDDGQLTLRTLFRGGVSCDGQSAPTSPVWQKTARARRASVDMVEPGADAPMSAWIDWLAQTVGAELALPGHSSVERRTVHTPRDLAIQVHNGHPAQTFFVATLRLLAMGVDSDPGLAENGPRTGRRCLRLMAQATRRATALAQVRAGRVERLSRPAVTAARFAVMHARDDLQTGPNGAVLRAALDELSDACPNLLHWISRLNAATNPLARFRENLMLAPVIGAAGPLHAADSAAQVLVAGALATVIKGMFDLPGEARHLIRPANGDLDTRALDRMAGDVALGRTIAGGYYHAENHADLRMGEALGLQILREALEADNQTASVELRGLDGQSFAITANPRAFGRAHATLRCNGSYARWAGDARRSAAHLTAVV